MLCLFSYMFQRTWKCQWLEWFFLFFSLNSQFDIVYKMYQILWYAYSREIKINVVCFLKLWESEKASHRQWKQFCVEAISIFLFTSIHFSMLCVFVLTSWNTFYPSYFASVYQIFFCFLSLYLLVPPFHFSMFLLSLLLVSFFWLFLPLMPASAFFSIAFVNVP